LPPDGNPVTAIGHGNVSQGATPGVADYLNEVEISIVPIEDCNDLNSWNGFVKESQICAGASARGRGTCIGDIGGPLLMVGDTASDD
jgi:secreted trypsin-like serine protease